MIWGLCHWPGGALDVTATKEVSQAEPKVGVTGPSTSWSAGPQRIAVACHCRHYWTDSHIFAFAQKCHAARRSGLGSVCLG